MEYQTIRVTPVASCLGARVDGMDLRASLDGKQVEELHRALLEHLVVFLPGQTIDDDRQIELAQTFGQPHPHPVGAFLGDQSLMGSVSTDDYRPGVDSNCHTDYTFHHEVPDVAVLRAVTVPDHGGDTMWANTCAAYDALSDGMRRLVDRLIGVNSAALKHGGGRSAMHKTIGGMRVHDTDSADQYEAEHPVARTHPETARKALYVSRSHTIHFKDMSEEESRPLIDWLQAHQTRPEFTCRVRWAPGTLTVWDNRCTQHNAINDYHGQRRRMRRLTVGAQTPR